MDRKVLRFRGDIKAPGKNLGAMYYGFSYLYEIKKLVEEIGGRYERRPIDRHI